MEAALPNLLNGLVNCRITLGGAQGLVNQILKRELQPSGEDIGFRLRNREFFSSLVTVLFEKKTDCTILKSFDI